jgi:hypothetical protein
LNEPGQSIIRFYPAEDAPDTEKPPPSFRKIRYVIGEAQGRTGHRKASTVFQKQTSEAQGRTGRRRASLGLRAQLYVCAPCRAPLYAGQLGAPLCTSAQHRIHPGTHRHSYDGLCCTGVPITGELLPRTSPF